MMTHFTGRERKLEKSGGPTIKSKEIEEQTKEFLEKKGSKIEIIDKGRRAQPLAFNKKRTTEEARQAWSNNKVHDNN